MKTQQQAIDSFCRTAYLIEDVATIVAAHADAITRGDDMKALALDSMIRDCKEAGVENYGDLPL